MTDRVLNFVVKAEQAGVYWLIARDEFMSAPGEDYVLEVSWPRADGKAGGGFVIHASDLWELCDEGIKQLEGDGSGQEGKGPGTAP